MMIFEPETWMEPETWGSDKEIQRKLRVDARGFLDSLCRNWRERIVSNAKYLDGENYFSSLFGTWNMRHIICVGAGKSAFDSVEHIKNGQLNGFKIVACDHMRSFLRENGVHPDLTISLDPTERVGMFFENCDKEDVVVMDIKQHPAVVDKVVKTAGKVYFYSALSPFSVLSNHVFKNYPKALTSLLSSATVGFVAVDACYKMIRDYNNQNVIIMIGHDHGWHSLGDIPEDHYKGQQLLKGRLPNSKEFYSIRPFASSIEAYHEIFVNKYGEKTQIELVDASGGALYIRNYYTMKSAVELFRLRIGDVEDEQERIAS